jgi:hypothetical protein
MALSFPNPSRSYDVARNCVCFWGYDGAIEVSFYLDIGALQKLRPEMNDVGTGWVEAFDVEEKRIHKVAAMVYARGDKGPYACSLSADDF